MSNNERDDAALPTGLFGLLFVVLGALAWTLTSLGVWGLVGIIFGLATVGAAILRQRRSSRRR